MKLTKLTKRILACGLGLAMVVSSINVSSLEVSAAKKSKMKLSKSKVSVTAGSTATLKVNKANKKVQWSTSNKKIAKVTKTSGKKKENATIQGVKKGNAVITAKVGKVKLTCKVTVAANQIKSVSVDKLDPSALEVKFTKKTSLSASQVKVAVKAYKEGSFNRNPKVDAVSTSDQKTYRLYLSSAVPYSGVVQVKVGKFTAETQRKQTFIANEAEVAKLWEKEVSGVYGLNYLFAYNVGKISYSLKKGSKLPAGLSLVGKRGIIKGIPTKAGETKVTVEATDELKRKASVTITFKVYDEVTVAANDYKREIRLDDYTADRIANTAAPATGMSIVTEIPVKPEGGSGKYTFELAAPDVPGVTLSTDTTNPATNVVTHETADRTVLSIPYAITEGSHTYAITVKDVADPNRVTTSTVTVNAVNYFNVSGTVQDAMGTALSGQEEIYMIPAKANSFSELIGSRTYVKQEMTDSGYYKSVAGNYRFSYSSTDSYTDQYNDSIRYKVYEDDTYTAVVGPWPVPTPLHEAPTPAPTQGTATQAPADGTPAPTPFKVPDLAAGNYAAEVPAGDYIVKVLGANDVAYQLDTKLTVSADAVGTANLTMPVRFANISATAKYKNGLAMENETLYFETDSGKYERSVFSIDTNYEGKFSVSLPAGTYHAYWYDEATGKDYYFENAVTVEDATNAELGDFLLSVARYSVTGTAFRAATTEGGQNTTMDGVGLYFVDANGMTTYADTEEKDDIFDAAKNEYVPNPANGTFKVLLADGTYSVRAYRAGAYTTIGAVTVAGANQENLSLVMDPKTEYANAAQINLETEAVMDSTGNNDVMAKFTIAEAGRYEITAALNGNQSMGSYLKLYNEAGENLYLDTDDTDKLGRTVAVENLDAGNYYLKATPYRGYKQIVGKVSLRVGKYVEAYESAVAMTAGTPMSVNCSKNVAKDDFEHAAYVKFTAEAGKTYQIDCSTATIGVSNIRVTAMKNASVTNGTLKKSGKAVVTADEAGDVYLKVSASGEFTNNAVINLTLTAVQ